MTALSNSLRLIIGALVGVDKFNPLASVVVFQYNPDTLRCTLLRQGGGGLILGSAQQGPACKHIKLDAHTDIEEQLKFLYQDNQGGE